jgi:hypothetical protein
MTKLIAKRRQNRFSHHHKIINATSYHAVLTDKSSNIKQFTENKIFEKLASANIEKHEQCNKIILQNKENHYQQNIITNKIKQTIISKNIHSQINEACEVNINSKNHIERHLETNHYLMWLH